MTSLNPKNSEGINFQPKNIHRTYPSGILQVLPPWGLFLEKNKVHEVSKLKY